MSRLRDRWREFISGTDMGIHPGAPLVGLGSTLRSQQPSSERSISSTGAVFAERTQPETPPTAPRATRRGIPVGV